MSFKIRGSVMNSGEQNSTIFEGQKSIIRYEEPALKGSRFNSLPVQSGCVLHLFAGEGVGGTTTGSDVIVSVWDDLSGNGNTFFQNTQSNMPLLKQNVKNNLPAVRFFPGESGEQGGWGVSKWGSSLVGNIESSGTPNIFNQSSLISYPFVSGTTPGEIFYVLVPTASFGYEGGISTFGSLPVSGNLSGSVFFKSNGTISENFGSETSYSISISGNKSRNWWIYNVSSDTQFSASLTGSQITASATNTVGWTNDFFKLGVGTNNNNVNNYFNGYIGEVIMFNRKLNSSERNDVLSFLGETWDLLEKNNNYLTFPLGFEKNYILDEKYQSSEMNLTGNFTIEFWSLTVSGGGDVVSRGNQQGNAFQYEIERNLFNSILTISFNGIATTAIVGLTAGSVGPWYHFAFRRDSSTGIIDAIVNGVWKGGLTGSVGDLYNPQSEGRFRIGKGCSDDNNISGSYRDSILDEIRIWNVHRTISDIDRDRLKVLNGNEDGLVAYYKCERGLTPNTIENKNVLLDSTGNGNNIFSYTGGGIEHFPISYAQVNFPFKYRNQEFDSSND